MIVVPSSVNYKGKSVRSRLRRQSPVAGDAGLAVAAVGSLVERIELQIGVDRKDAGREILEGIGAVGQRQVQVQRAVKARDRGRPTARGCWIGR